MRSSPSAAAIRSVSVLSVASASSVDFSSSSRRVRQAENWNIASA
jgi:hypothetical protein